MCRDDAIAACGVVLANQFVDTGWRHRMTTAAGAHASILNAFQMHSKTITYGQLGPPWWRSRVQAQPM